jgi:hypothetical protein
MTTYDADIHVFEPSDGRHVAILRGSDIGVCSANAEHDLMFEMTKAGLPDGSIQFWRGTTPTLSYKSVHRAGAWRVELGQQEPYRLVKRDTGRAERRLRSSGAAPGSST